MDERGRHSALGAARSARAAASRAPARRAARLGRPRRPGGARVGRPRRLGVAALVGRACRLGAATAVLAAACVVGLTALGAAPAGATGSPSWSASTAAPPSAPPAQVSELETVSCAPGGTCAALGDYSVGAGYRGLSLSGGSGTWTAAHVPLPAGAYSNWEPDYEAVSCPSDGGCEAVGWYLNGSSFFIEGLLLAESGGSWSATQAPLPPDALTWDQFAEVFSVSCSSVGNCGAIGFYLNSSSDFEYMLLSEVSGSWTATSLPVPQNSGSGAGAISCTAPGTCVAVGGYVDSSNVEHPLLFVESSGSWTAIPAPLPANAAASLQTSLTNVSCTTTGCVAIGTYKDTSSNVDGLLLTNASGSWTASEAPLPAGAPGAGETVSLADLSCPAAGSCTAAGSYTDSAGNTEGLLLGQSGASWSALQAPLPAGAATSGQSASISGLSCPSSSSCTATGRYVDGSGSSQAMLLVLDPSTGWSAIEAPVPAGSSASYADVFSVSCSSPGC
jgi:hypothetical protein